MLFKALDEIDEVKKPMSGAQFVEILHRHLMS